VGVSALSANTLANKLEAHLVDSGLVSLEQLELANTASLESKTPIEDILIDQGLLSDAQYAEFVQKTTGVALTKLEELSYTDMELLSTLPDEMMEEKRVIPTARQAGRLVVAMVDPTDRATISEIVFVTGMRPQVVAIRERDFKAWWEKYESQQMIKARGSVSKQNELASSLKQATTAQQEQKASISTGVNLDTIRQQAEAELQDNANPLVRFVNSLLAQAIEMGASDIHVEPRETCYVVRFRMDGVLKQVLEIPATMESSVITRLKVMAKMDISDHRRPQDGRMAMNWKKTDYNIRVNTLPVTDGREKIVLRILRPAKHITDFDKLGFSPADVASIEHLYKSPYGIVLVCGPTGSGKSTSLYTILNKINSELINVSTVEDPVELKIEGLNQSQVNPKADFTFASSMRALLRQDPDVIMVGEIRDYETLEAAIHAALTGHLVFSTIHANTAATTITRMLEMGASASLIGAALNGVIAQRLVRQLCPHCKTPHHATEEEMVKLFPNEPDKWAEPSVIYHATGCNMCKNSGYLGRMGLYEIMMVNRELRHLIGAQVSDLEIEDLAVTGGMRTLSQSAKQRILEGLTSIEEIERVLGPMDIPLN
jgi:type IV pilus assembly protein PilB